jgi:DNA-binding NarL/FixJ family response regulator
LDISLPDRSGLDCVRDIKIQYENIKILMFSVFPDDKFALRAIKIGADGYLNKNSSSSEIINAIKKVMTGGKYLKSEMVDELLINPEKAFKSISLEILSDREFEVLRMIASGLKMNQMAEKLNLSVNTIASYKERIQEKLNLKSTADLTRYAIENKLIE